MSPTRPLSEEVWQIFSPKPILEGQKEPWQWNSVVVFFGDLDVFKHFFNQSQFCGGFLVYMVVQQLQMFWDRFVIKINDLLTKIVTKICRFVPSIHGNLLPLVSGFHILWCSLVVSLVHWSDWIQWTRKMMYASWFLENGRSTRTNLGSHSGYVYLFHTEIPKIHAYLDSINMNARLNASHSNFKHLSQAFFWGPKWSQQRNLAKGNHPMEFSQGSFPCTCSAAFCWAADSSW